MHFPRQLFRFVVLTVLAVICSAHILHAEEIIGTSAKNPETVKTYNTEFIFRGFIRRPFLNITMRHYTPKDEKNNSEVISYAPNTLANWGGSFSWRGFGFSFGFDSPKSEKDESLYGNTKYYDFQAYFYWQNFGFDAHYQKYQGFYLRNPEKHGYAAGSPEALRPDIKAISIGCNVFWSFFEEFSFSAAFDQSQRQLSTAFSPLLMASFNKFSIESDYSIIPPSQESYYGKFSGYTGGDYTGIAITPGFAITYVWNQYWYASAAGFLGSGWMHKNYSTAQGKTTENKPFGKGNLRASFGYNDDDLFAGIQGTWDFTASERTFRRNRDEEMTEVIAVTADISIFFGKRF